MIKVGIVGVSGRMGQEIKKVLENYPEACFSDGYSSSTGSIENVFEKSDIVIDFSSVNGFFNCCELAKKTNKILVSGTTGFTQPEEERIQKISKDIVVVMSSNMSFGVNLFFKFAKELSAVLKNNNEYDAEIIETHHIKKKDSPSGTAITLGKKVAEGRGQNFDEVFKYGRDLTDKAKQNGEIGFSAVRSGGIIGEHTLIFGSENDRIELSHRAYNRSIFAKGAVDLAVRVFNKNKIQTLQNGLYAYEDFL